MAVASPAKKKILMLHGYMQSDRIFKAKVGGLRKKLKKLGYDAMVPCAIEVAGIKDSDPDAADVAKKLNTSDADHNKLYGWYIKNGPPTAVNGDYEIKQQTFDYLRDYIIENGPFEGIMGFSQGAGVAGYLLTDFYNILNLTEEQQPPFKFFVAFSGFRLEPDQYQQTYLDNLITTPSLHVIGELDTLVTEERSSSLFNACAEGSKTQLVHPGGHFVPSSNPFQTQICNWIQMITLKDDDPKKNQRKRTPKTIQMPLILQQYLT
ncbi:hypothetical protein TPHA_0G01330 [Tetrapisispora phaffii CBS 4417]|uniref:Serine hydrolase domain-containing protein n=1 Tax=Tetrapisispora phaffii (strain ATCC 24235 / CBS 4417 / NBRC 1672 / NRRL Y-8282 / UCD 70-5) TaxID=1071381 RepID=G8BVP2_TETPH|nr:hypothetical protein TPHA_0G01330 [Tetrapisispora phaffii CBS 4417]CCE63970.1 hypothetical protein TPHA_0G01330 [Tetrapisispora phaffii CBS 4417]